MVKRVSAVIAAVSLIAVLASAQQSSPANAGGPVVSAILDQQISRVEKSLVPMASEMPEKNFDFAPTNGEFKGVRTFSQQVKHIAGTNYRIGAAILGEKPPVSMNGEAGPANLKTKADVVKFLNESYVYIHKAFGSITDKNLTEPIPSPFGSGKATRLGLATALIGDQWDHYGQMVVYFRMNGFVPPASRR